MDSITLAAFNGSIYFTSAVPDVTITLGSGAAKALVTITCGGSQVYQETLWPIGISVTLTDLGELLEPAVRAPLVSSVTIDVQPQTDEGESSGGSQSATGTLLFARADVGVSASAFYGSRFLTLLDGPKVTALGRREVLWYYGSESASVTAYYDDDTSQSFSAGVAGGNGLYTCINVSPDLFETSGKRLCRYEVTAGSRVQEFVIDFEAPDCAPILEFYNSFGVWEMLYCTGTHRVNPEYKRSTTRIRRQLHSYRIEETRKFEADTGVLNRAMANWADELFRSDKVFVVNVYNGSVSNENGGKEVIILESKSVVTNDDADLPRFTFSYQYAQQIHNVVDMQRVGRIFDNTFDQTFN